MHSFQAVLKFYSDYECMLLSVLATTLTLTVNIDYCFGYSKYANSVEQTIVFANF
jgi:hypothetical protein